MPARPFPLATRGLAALLAPGRAGGRVVKGSPFDRKATRGPVPALLHMDDAGNDA